MACLQRRAQGGEGQVAILVGEAGIGYHIDARARLEAVQFTADELEAQEDCDSDSDHSVDLDDADVQYDEVGFRSSSMLLLLCVVTRPSTRMAEIQ